MFADRLKEIMTLKGLTQTDVAKKIGITRQMVGAYFVYGRQPTLPVIAEICKSFNISADYLLELETESATKSERFTSAVSRITPQEIGAAIASGHLEKWCADIRSDLMSALDKTEEM